MCTVLLPPGVNPIPVNKYIIRDVSYHIIYHIISYHISYHSISYIITSYHISHHMISYHIIYYIICITSYHIPYHITSYHISRFVLILQIHSSQYAKWWFWGVPLKTRMHSTTYNQMRWNAAKQWIRISAICQAPTPFHPRSHPK